MSVGANGYVSYTHAGWTHTHTRAHAHTHTHTHTHRHSGYTVKGNHFDDVEMGVVPTAPGNTSIYPAAQHTAMLNRETRGL